MPAKVPLAHYIFTRLRQLNCRSIHGVPGDFFLRALDHTRAAGINWIGNANELCAGYAADGYARAGMHAAARKSGTGPMLGAFLTTYGVG
jgi:pyruvate decarboxylase